MTTTRCHPLCAAMAGLVLASATVAQAELATPTGPVVLTLVGDITNTNRGPMDPAVDKLMVHHEQAFEAAASFDLDMLAALGTETRRFALTSLPEAQQLEGPSLGALLEAVGAEKGSVTVLALDGYALELDARGLEAHDWLLGLKRNGRALGLGDFGPAWLVFTPAAADGVPTQEEARMWPFQVFLIRVDGK